jgi:hypothetical protein
MSKSRHHHNLPRGSHDIEQRQQEQPLLVDAAMTCSGTGNTCLNVDDDELKVVTTTDGPERTGSSVVVDGLPIPLGSSTTGGVNPPSGIVRRPSVRGQVQPGGTTTSTTWKLKYQDFMPTMQSNVGLWDKSESFQ